MPRMQRAKRDSLRTKTSRRARLIAMLLAVCGLMSLPLPRLQAATFDIANGDVAGLIAAINTSNANGVPDTINLASSSTYTLTARDNTQYGFNGLPTITSPITINGNGATITRDGAAPTFRLFYVAPGGNLALDSVTLSNGSARGGNGGTNLGDDGGGGGGGAGLGGAIYNQGSLSITNSTLSGNTARGGNGGAGADHAGNDSGGGGGGGGLGGNGGTVPDTGADGGGGGGGFGGDGGSPNLGDAGGGGGGTVSNGANASGSTGGAGGTANGGAGGAFQTNGAPGGLGGGGGGGGNEANGGAGGTGGGGGGSGETDDSTLNVGGNGGFGGGGGGGGEDNAGGNGGFGGGGGGAHTSNDQIPIAAGTGGLLAGNGGLVTIQSSGGGGGAGMGGALFNDSGTTTITNSTITGNTAQGGTGGAGTTATQNGQNGQGGGGGIFLNGGTLTLTSVTFTGNTADQQADIYNNGGSIILPGFNLIKLTNGTNNDTAPGVFVPVGSQVTFTYLVTNPGGLPLSGVTARDDNGTPGNPADDFNATFVGGDTNGNSLLDPGETFTFTASRIATPGQYTNVGTATGTPSPGGGPQVSDTNPDNHFGALPAINIVKLTNGTDNDAAPGPFVPVGSTVTFTYVVSNTGNVPLSGITVHDDNGTPGNAADDFNAIPVLSGGFNVGDTDQDNLLDTGEMWRFTASRIATLGQHTNIGTATGTPPPGAGSPASDTNPDHHFGALPVISLVKRTNGTDNNTAPGPFVPSGSPVTFTYLVTNPGNVPLSGVTVRDDNGTPGNTADDFNATFVGGDTNGNVLLDPGETFTFTATRIATSGQYTNTGTATGTPPPGSGPPVSDTDVDNHFGTSPPPPLPPPPPVLPSLSISDGTTLQEGDSGISIMLFTVSLSGPTPEPITIFYQSLSGSAQEGVDFQAVPDPNHPQAGGTLTFSVGGPTQQQILVSIVGDTLPESDERVVVELYNPSPGHAPVSDAHGEGVILNDDVQPPVSLSLSINDVTVTESDSGSTNAQFTVSLSIPSAQPVSVEYATAQGSATAPEDFAATNGNFVFQPGETTKQISVPVMGDGVFEGTEQFPVLIFNPTGASVAKGQGLCTITDNDPATHSVSGRITLSVGGTANGVQVALQDAFGNHFFTTTSSNGDYTFPSVVPGNFLVRPVSETLVFEPPTRFGTITDSDMPGQDFVASSR